MIDCCRRDAVRIAAFGVCCALAHVAHAQDAVADDVRHFARLVTPLTGQEVIGKKPRIHVAIGVPYAAGSLYVTLDGIDITSQVVAATDGLTYSPRQPLPGGQHVLSVSLRTQDQLDLREDFSFGSRHTRSLQQFASGVRAGADAENLLDHREQQFASNDYRLQGEMLYQLQAAQERWQAAVNTNLWYINQKLPVFPPQRERLDLASYLISGSRRGTSLGLGAELGDVRVLGTPRTFSTLARRGTNLGFEYRNLALTGFAVSSEQLFGFRGGTGIGTDPDSNIYGFTAGAGFLNNRLHLRAVHSQGGEPIRSYGFFSDSGASQGRVTGYVLRAQPWPSLNVEAEYDQSQFDADPSDQFASRSDDAYGLRVSGQKNVFNYQLGYEHLGADYRVIGGYVPSDQENVAASGGLQLGRHSFNGTARHQRDNVDEDPARSRRQNAEWQLTYGLFASNRWFLSADYRDSHVTSSSDPFGFSAQDLTTRSAAGRARYTSGRWSAGFEAAVSEQDDATSDFGDSKVVTFAFTPGYQSTSFSIVPYVGHNITTFGGSGLEQEQTNLSLMLNGQLWHERIAYSATASLYGQKYSDGSFDSRTGSTDLRLSYRFRRPANQPPLGTLNLRLSRSDSRERTSGTESQDWSLWLTATFSPQFSF
jgi:hypothetical protein